MVWADDAIYINFQETGNPKPLRTGIVHLEDAGLKSDYGFTARYTKRLKSRFKK